jgi:Fe-S cluster assembly protein SufD
MVNGTQHVDNQVMVDHQQPYTTSRQNYKGILDGQSQAVFHGSITVREGARKSDARQNDKNLLLSNEAEADTKPALWIYCDDVKVGHGAASGQIDERALFYLQSRGVDQATARRLLVRAFASEIIDSATLEPVKAYMEKIFAEQAQEYRLT